MSRASAHSLKDDYDRAIADYTEMIRIDPTNANGYSGRCRHQAFVGRNLQRALADCNEALRLNPKSDWALDCRGLTYLKLGQIEKALADYDASLTIDPKYAWSLYGRGWAKLKKGDKAGGRGRHRRGEDDPGRHRRAVRENRDEVTRF